MIGGNEWQLDGAKDERFGFVSALLAPSPALGTLLRGVCVASAGYYERERVCAETLRPSPSEHATKS